MPLPEPAIRLHLHGFGRVDDDGTIGQALRADGRDDQDVALGTDNRAARRQRIGSRTGRRRNDQAVATVMCQRLKADLGAQIDEARICAAGDDRVVQGPAGKGFRAGLADG